MYDFSDRITNIDFFQNCSQSLLNSPLHFFKSFLCFFFTFFYVFLLGKIVSMSTLSVMMSKLLVCQIICVDYK